MSRFHDEVPEVEGFRQWMPLNPGRFIDSYGPILARVEGAAVARCRVVVGLAQANLHDKVHGGFIMAFVDQVAFVAADVLDRLPAGGAVTLGASIDFVAPAGLDRPLDAVVEMVGETGRMLFLRGFMEQGETRVASFTISLRKIRDRPAA